MALSAARERDIETADPGRQRVTIANGSTIYWGALVGIDTDVGSSSQGRAVPYDDTTDGVVLAGRAILFIDSSDQTNEVSLAGTASGGEAVVIDTRPVIVERVTVTSGSATSVGQPVFLTDDDESTYVLAPPSTYALPVGVVHRHHTGTTCDVRRFSLEESAQIGNSRSKVFLGRIDFAGIGGNATELTSRLGVRGFVVGTEFVLSNIAIAGGGSESIDLTLHNGAGTAIPGCSQAGIDASYVDASNFLAQSGTSGEAYGQPDDEFTVRGTNYAASFTAGALDVFVHVINVPGN